MSISYLTNKKDPKICSKLAEIIYNNTTITQLLNSTILLIVILMSYFMYNNNNNYKVTQKHSKLNKTNIYKCYSIPKNVFRTTKVLKKKQNTFTLFP